MDLQGKVAIVTGGGTGMGKEIAKLLAAAGTHVVVNYSRSEAGAWRPPWCAQSRQRFDGGAGHT
jgi:NAD(P)-dependent dehydrogenase (short-subunit alcohol dehydrogenase family)